MSPWLLVQIPYGFSQISSRHGFCMSRHRHGFVSTCRLSLKAGCAPCLAGCRWYGICTKWVENLLFEVILMAFSSVSRPETWRTLFFHQKTLSGGQKRYHFSENMLQKRKKECVLLNSFRSSRARAGPIWTRKIKMSVKERLYRCL